MSNNKKITNFKKHQIIENEEKTLLFLYELLENIPKNAKRLESRKNNFSGKHKISTLKNRELIVVAKKHNIILPEKLQKLIIKRAVRTVSGVSPIGILTKPFECPGKCIYCPTEDRMPKSYMKNQPAAARALRNNFDPFHQVKNRIISLEESGHPASKLEIIVMGGTWSFLPRQYQNFYISEVFRAANSFDISPSCGNQNNIGAYENMPEENIIKREDNKKAYCHTPLQQQKPIIFLDFDGVIANSYNFVFEMTQQAFQNNNVEMDREIFRKIFRSAHLWSAFEEAGGTEKSVKEYSELEKKHYSNSVMLYDEIIDVLQTFSQYFDLKIISANQKIVIDEFCKKNHISGLFSEVIGRETEGSKSEKMKKILTEHQQKPENTFFIGDTISDMKEGKAAGVKTIGAGWGNIFTADELQEVQPFAVCEKIKDLENLFALEPLHIAAGKKEGEIKEIDCSRKDQNIVGAKYYQSEECENMKIDYSRKAQNIEPLQLQTQNIDPLQHFQAQNIESLQHFQAQNEKASHRIIGLTLETRPDFITEQELIRMRKYGCTRIEVGVQTLHDDVAEKTKRGHYKKHVVKAMRLMKDFGFKVCFHLMPGLPGSNPERDLEMMKEVFENPDFRPDFIKIYPCMVLPTSELASVWEKGDFQPITDIELIKLLIKFKAYVPEWTRIMRFMRDIPANNILDGSKFSNLRQILQEQPKKLLEIVGKEFFEKHDLENNAKKLFRDIRSREVGFSSEKIQNPVLKRRDYDASQGTEVFLSFESDDESQLFALLRLRKSSQLEIKNEEFRAVLKNSALIREVHSYGSEITVGDNSDEQKSSGQHKGLGKKLIVEAERIAKEEWNEKKMVIIAGVGTREYYRKWGYEEICGYMVKEL